MFSAVRLGFGSIKNRSRDPQSSWQCAETDAAAVTGKNQKRDTEKGRAPTLTSPAIDPR
jgi:hypothetical protein